MSGIAISRSLLKRQKLGNRYQRNSPEELEQTRAKNADPTRARLPGTRKCNACGELRYVRAGCKQNRALKLFVCVPCVQEGKA